MFYNTHHMNKRDFEALEADVSGDTTMGESDGEEEEAGPIIPFETEEPEADEGKVEAQEPPKKKFRLNGTDTILTPDFTEVWSNPQALFDNWAALQQEEDAWYYNKFVPYAEHFL